MSALVVKEDSSCSAGLSLPVDFEINVLENACLGGRRAFISELGRRVCFSFELGVDGFVLFFSEDLFCYEMIFENPNGIVLVLVFLDLLLFAVAALVFSV